MRSRLPISCFIIAKNEADRIGRTIESVRDWVDEIIVVDSGSTDSTVSLCESLGCRVLYHHWQGYGLQKRFGEEQCRNIWLLNLDADEVVTPALADEIAAQFAQGEPSFSAYYLKVRDLLPGEKRLAPLAHTNTCLRLYDKRKGRFSESTVHDSVMMEEGKTCVLQAPVLHYSFRSLSHMLEKIRSYSSAQADDLKAKRLKFPYLRLIIEMPFGFFKMLLLRGYILRGPRGFVYSAVYGYGRWLRVVKYLRMKMTR